MAEHDYELQQVKTYVQNKQIDEARAVLYEILEDPVAQKWLERINEFDPPDEQSTLKVARGMLEGRRFSAARVTLKTLPRSQTAKNWLAKLEQISPEKDEKKEKENAEPLPGGAMRVIGDFLRSFPYRILLGGALAALNVGLIFFWATETRLVQDTRISNLSANVEQPDEETAQSAQKYEDELAILIGPTVPIYFFPNQEVEYTALDVAMGTHDGENFTLELYPLLGCQKGEKKDDPDKCVADGTLKPEEVNTAPRLVDRLLLLVPLFAVINIILTVFIVIGNRKKQPLLFLFLIILFSGISLGVYLGWETISQNTLAGSVRSQLAAGRPPNTVPDELVDFIMAFTFDLIYRYETGMFPLVGGIAIATALGAWLLGFLERADFFGAPLVRSQE